LRGVFAELRGVFALALAAPIRDRVLLAHARLAATCGELRT